MNIPVAGFLKDAQGRFIVAALFDWELADELADPATDGIRRDALQRVLKYRGIRLEQNEAQERGVP